MVKQKQHNKSNTNISQCHVMPHLMYNMSYVLCYLNFASFILDVQFIFYSVSHFNPFCVYICVYIVLYIIHMYIRKTISVILFSFFSDSTSEILSYGLMKMELTTTDKIYTSHLCLTYLILCANLAGQC